MELSCVLSGGVLVAGKDPSLVLIQLYGGGASQFDRRLSWRSGRFWARGSQARGTGLTGLCHRTWACSGSVLEGG